MKETTMLNRITLLFLGCLTSGCLATAPIHPEATRHNATGVTHLQSGRLKQAATSFHLSLEYNPCHPDALHNLALIALLNEDLATAERYENEALTCRPDLVQAINGLGVVRRAQGNLEEALEMFEQAIAMDPGYLEARKNLILTALDLGRRERARVQLNRLAILAPEDPFIPEVDDVLHNTIH
jgi:tetratricopeptide (TPR) repeat protein